RHNRDADRWIIEKGSVFYINSGEINNDVVENGVGSHLAEGFGKVLINPSFLLSNDNKLPGKYEVIDKLKKQYIPKLEIKNSSYDVFMNLLKKKKAINDSESDINKTVNEFIKDNENKFNKVTNSQWGQVRTYAKYAQNYLTLKALLFDDPGGFMFHGQTEEIWSKGREVFKEKVESFFNDTEKIDFTIKLASQMAKTNGGNK
ncbi:MAG: hypothetical protein U9R32_09105, partial [Bacteroidota bacterium]|nr:hypothetical protein [Bacteroidota bacterium]